MQVRAQVQAVKDRLELGLDALAAAASGSHAATAAAIAQFAHFVDPLMTSALVGPSAAHSAACQLCASLGPGLQPHASELAVALRLAMLGEVILVSGLSIQARTLRLTPGLLLGCKRLCICWGSGQPLSSPVVWPASAHLQAVCSSTPGLLGVQDLGFRAEGQGDQPRPLGGLLLHTGLAKSICRPHQGQQPDGARRLLAHPLACTAQAVCLMRSCLALAWAPCSCRLYQSPGSQQGIGFRELTKP